MVSLIQAFSDLAPLALGLELDLPALESADFL